MTKKVFLHVGLPKSGTTYLQAVLGSNKGLLKKRASLLYPGERWVDQLHATRDVLGADPPGGPNPRTEGAWQRLVDEIAAWDGDAVISMEWLCSANPDQARRMVETLAPAETHVVVTARDLARTIPTAWQEFLQNWELWSWPEFVGAVTSENPRGTPAGNLFWRQQDLGRLLAIWRDVVPPEQLHIVTLPQPGAPAGVLWERFATVLEIEPGQYDASGRGSNESLGLESAELMLRLNSASRVHGMEWRVYDEMFKHALAKRGLAKRKHRESPVYRLPPELEGWTRARTDEHIRAIAASGAHVVGDLDDLQPGFPTNAEAAGGPTADAVLDAAVEGLVAVARDRGDELARLRGQVARLRQENRRLKTTGPKASIARGWTDRMRPGLIEASERHSWLMGLRRAYSSVARR